MKAIRNFIVQSEGAFSESYETESGLKIFADKRLSAERLSNRVVAVTSVPPQYQDGEIKEGYELMVDPTIFFRQNYEGRGEQDNTFMIDREKGVYMVEPKLIVLYRKSPEDEWKAYGNSILIEIRKENVEKMYGLIAVNEVKETVVILYSNTEAEEMGVLKGDEVLIRKGFDVPFWISGKEYSWIDNTHLLAKLN